MEPKESQKKTRLASNGFLDLKGLKYLLEYVEHLWIVDISSIDFLARIQ